MARGIGKLTPKDKLDMQEFAIRLNSILSERNCTQAELARQTKIPPSTITSYVKGTSLPVPGNVQKIADFFGLLKSDIDPRFKSDKSITAPKNVSDEVLRLDKGLHQDNRKNWIRYGN